MSGATESSGEVGHVPNQLAVLVPTFDPAVDYGDLDEQSGIVTFDLATNKNPRTGNKVSSRLQRDGISKVTVTP